jgi:hypothetical protein
LSTNPILKESIPKLCTKYTDWSKFGDIINSNINLNLRLKEEQGIDEAVQYRTTLIQNAAWRATPEVNNKQQHHHNVPLHIRELVVEKRRARRRWQISRAIQGKGHLNRLIHRLRSALNKFRNASFHHYISSLASDDQSIWKATKKFKRPALAILPIRKTDGNRARTDTEKACAFADYLANVFTPFPANSIEDGLRIKAFLDAPRLPDPPLKLLSPKEVKQEITHISSYKAPGYYLIVGEILKHRPRKALVLLTVIFNSILR